MILNLLIFLGLSQALLREALASHDHNYGLGATSSGRVGGVTADRENPFAAVYNPALISTGDLPRFGFTTAIARAQYGTLKGVLVDSPDFRTETGVSETRDFQLPDSRLFLWAVGLSYPFRLPPAVGKRRVGLGVVLAGPFTKLHSFRSSTPYDFTALRYGTSDSQMKGTLGTSVELWPNRLYLGVGLSLFITAAGTAEATIAAENPSGRSALDVGLNSAAILGLTGGGGDDWVALVFRQKIAPTFVQKFVGKVQLAGEDTLYQPLLFQSTLYYEPHTFETEWQHDFGGVKASVGLSYQLWKGYQPSFLVASAPNAHGEVSSTRLPPLALQNTLNPRASLVVPLFTDRLVIAGGYQYRPTPVADLSGPGNLLDTNTHILGISVQHRLQKTAEFPAFSWGLFGQYHWLKHRPVTKAAPDFVGAPHYDFSGSAYTYGISIQAEL